MMVPVKIQCGCGQRYAFDVETMDGRMPAPVACPVCGMDGTSAAEAVMAREVQTRPKMVTMASNRQSTSAGDCRIPDSSGGPGVAQTVVGPTSKRLPGQLERAQALHEARAKVLWGDGREEVIKFLMLQGVHRGEAAELVQPMFQERASTIRATGLRRILSGCGMICVPIAAFVFFSRMGVLPIKLFAMTVAVGLWGGWRVLNGGIMLASPSMAPGDVAEH